MALIDDITPQQAPRNRYRRPIFPVRRTINPAAARPQSTSPPQPTEQAPILPKKTFEVPVRRVGRIKLVLQGMVIIVLAVVLGLATSTQQIGEIAIGIYAVIALVLRFSSRTTFALALLAFAMIMLLEVVRPTSDLAANFAVYAFLLLVVGTLSLSLEVRQEAKWEKWRKQPKHR